MDIELGPATRTVPTCRAGEFVIDTQSGAIYLITEGAKLVSYAEKIPLLQLNGYGAMVTTQYDKGYVQKFMKMLHQTEPLRLSR